MINHKRDSPHSRSFFVCEYIAQSGRKGAELTKAYIIAATRCSTLSHGICATKRFTYAALSVP